jgi:hypothetical protein
LSFKWEPKDPDEVLDYEHEWAALLVDGDTIDGPPRCVVEGEAGTLNVDNTHMAGTRQVVWLSGGEPGNYKLTIGIDTTAGRTFEEGIKLTVKER